MSCVMLFASTIIILAVIIPLHVDAECGCKVTRPCYIQMLSDLQEPGEGECIDSAAMGTATTTVFLKALSKYCDGLIETHNRGMTYEGKALYEVIINSSRWGNESKAVIVLDAGQDGTEDSVGFALYIIERLVACAENSELVKNFRWVILPSTNPDGLEYVRINREPWKKNLRLVDGGGYGVDLTRNFDVSWNLCPSNENIFSQDYPGSIPTSENETIFVTDVLKKYKGTISGYISFRGNGHSILYPFASKNSSNELTEKSRKMAAVVAAKVNQRGGNIQWFNNDSIIDVNGKVACGHSVDYALEKMGVPYTYEMRLFMKSDLSIISDLQPLPKGYDRTLRIGYFNGIKELYKSLLKERQHFRKYYSTFYRKFLN